MGLLSSVSDFFGLDIGTTAIRVVQIDPSSKQLLRYGVAPIDSNTAMSDSKADQQKIAQVLREVLHSSGITTKNVAVGVPSQRVFNTVVDIERLAPTELEKTIHYQADSLIPTPPAESKIDFAVIGDSPASANKVEVLLSSVTNEFVENRLDLLESIGLDVIAFEPDSIALSRSILPNDYKAPTLILDVGDKSTDLVIAMNGAPRLIRSIPTGAEAIVRAAVQNLSVEEKQAQEFVFKFGLSQQKLEGQVYNAIVSTVDLLVADIDKSIKFFETRYQGTKLDRIVITGSGSSLPEFPLYIANKFGIKVEIGNAWLNVKYNSNMQNDLMSVSKNFGVAAGLAERDV